MVPACVVSLLGIGVPVARRVQAAEPAPGQPWDHRVEVPGAEQASVEPELAGDRQPRLEPRQLRLVGGQREIATLDPLDVGAELTLEALPEPVGLDDERQLDRVAPLLADEAPVLPRLLAGHGPALHDGDTRDPAREEVRGGTADDAGAHDDDVRVPLHGRGASSVKDHDVSNALTGTSGFWRRATKSRT
jgi:hypothetical protein